MPMKSARELFLSSHQKRQGGRPREEALLNSGEDRYFMEWKRPTVSEKVPGKRKKKENRTARGAIL